MILLIYKKEGIELMSTCQICGNTFYSSNFSKSCDTCRKDIELKDSSAILIKQIKNIQCTYNIDFEQAISIVELQIKESVLKSIDDNLDSIVHALYEIYPR